MRLERFSIGKYEVPFNAYLGIHTERATKNYRISGYRAHPQFIWAMEIIKMVSTGLNRELKLIDARCADVIQRAADEVILGNRKENLL